MTKLVTNTTSLLSPMERLPCSCPFRHLVLVHSLASLFQFLYSIGRSRLSHMTRTYSYFNSTTWASSRSCKCAMTPKSHFSKVLRCTSARHGALRLKHDHLTDNMHQLILYSFLLPFCGTFCQATYGLQIVDEENHVTFYLLNRGLPS